MPDAEKLDSQLCVAILWALAEELGEDNDGISVPGIPDDDEEFDAFDNWTAGLLRRAIAVYASRGRFSAEDSKQLAPARLSRPRPHSMWI